MINLNRLTMASLIALTATSCNKLESKSGASSHSDTDLPGEDPGQSLPPGVAEDEPPPESGATTPAPQSASPAPGPTAPQSAPIELPPFPIPPNLEGIPLGEIEQLAATESFEVLVLSKQVVQAIEDRFRTEDQLLWQIDQDYQEAWQTYLEKKKEYDDAKENEDYPLPPYPYPPAHRGLNTAELEEIAAMDHLANAARIAFSGGAADQVSVSEHAYFALLSERSKVRSLEAMGTFLEKLMEKIKKLVDAGELPASRLQVLKASFLENDGALADAHKRLLEDGNAIARAVGEAPDRDPSIFADMELPNLADAPVPDLRSIESLAVTRSFAIQSLFEQREAALSRYRAAEWRLAVSSPHMPDEQREHEMTIEDAKAAALSDQMAQTDNQIREKIMAIEAGMKAAIIRFQTTQSMLVELEAVFRAEQLELGDGELELLQIVETVDRIVKTRHELEGSSIEFLTLQKDLDRALVTGRYGTLPLDWQSP